MKISIRLFLTLLIMITGNALFSQAAQTEDSWTHFRGSRLNGISEAHNIPVQWNDSTNLVWKTGIPGKGWSSPIVLDSQVWLTTASRDSKEMRAICLDYESGGIIHDLILFRPDSLYRIHAVNSYATPTGAIEPGRVYLHFGRYGTCCMDTDSGKILWSRTDLQCEHIQGPGSSLLIHDDKLIVHMEGSDIQYILALDKHSGKTIWRTERPKEIYDRLEYIGKKAYITPIVIKVNGREILISNGSAACIAYDVESGKEIWRIVQGEDSTISMPTTDGKLVYFYTSFVTDSSGEKKATLMAVDPSGKGEVGNSHVVWKRDSPELQLLTPVVLDGLLYTIDSKSWLQCLDAATGELIWEERMKGKFHASPVYADGHLYFSSTRGYVIVIRPGREFLQDAENRVDGEIWATPAILEGSILLRTSKYLYRIGKS